MRKEEERRKVDKKSEAKQDLEEVGDKIKQVQGQWAQRWTIQIGIQVANTKRRRQKKS